MTLFPPYTPPTLPHAADAALQPAPADGLLPPGFFTTTNLPTYVRWAGRWVLAQRARMDAHLVATRDGTFNTCEMRHIRAGDPVVCASTEDGSQGVFTHGNGFARAASSEAFAFMRGGPSRERPAPYADIVALLREHSRLGRVVWVLGPAVVHAGAREGLAALVHRGVVHAVLTGNAVAVHDVEKELCGTALGVDAHGNAAVQGHAQHIHAIHTVRSAGGLAALVQRGTLRSGLMHALISRGIPTVLAGSIRDDGPLPETVTDVREAQDRMREHCVDATLVVVLASALHGIAAGNMLPTFRVDAAGAVHPVPLICVDQDEFVLRKLMDRGSAQVLGVVTNVQDFVRTVLGMLDGAAP